MKPSDRINELVKKEIGDDWVAWAGNRYDRETWETFCMSEKIHVYTIRAIVKYLDEEREIKGE